MNIIFDLGGVLIDWNPQHLYRKIFDKEEDMLFFLENICTPEWNVQQDAGRTLQEAMISLAAQYPKYTSEIMAFYGRWTEMLGGPIEGTVEIFERTQRKRSVSYLCFNQLVGRNLSHCYRTLSLFRLV